MTFDEILAQIIDVLKRQGRVSYGALKRRFDLDDNYLKDLKDEILYVHPVREDEGRGLLWTGTTENVKEIVAQPTQPAQRTAAQAQPSPQVKPLSPTLPSSAERRQLTVMFCDLVDSTKLSSQLDPEEYRDVVRAYQKVCAEVITRFDGYIAQLLGDGLLVYFGYPYAHEDDAQRAVRTSLGILDALGECNKGLQQAKDVQLAIHMGIHTGLVVVGAMGDGGRQEQLALGETPNIAARIQGLAAPNTVAISAATARLVQGHFVCQDLGAQTLRGVSQPLKVYRVLGASGVHSRLDIASARGLTPLVGREQEVGLLLERWNQVKEKRGQVVLLTGEGGIGKSRLVHVLKDAVAREPHTRWECRSFSSFQNTALYPLTEPLQRAFHWQQDATPEAKLATLEQALRPYRLPVAETVPLFASLFSLPVPEDKYPPLACSPQRHRHKTLETIVALLLELAEHQPVLFILEDLHWTDPTTLEFLTLLIDQAPTASIYTLLTCRPEFQPPWRHRSYLTEVTVQRLSREQITRMAVQIAGGKTLPDEVLHQIVAKTDGVPLFVEELTKAVLESGHLKAVDGHYTLTATLPALAIPSTLQDTLMARLDRLVTAKGIAQVGATIGRKFSYTLLQAVSQLDALTLQRELGRLVEAELVYQRGLPPQATYTFKHALVQDAAAASLLKSTRQQYHERTAQVLEEQFTDIVETQPELLAHHCTAAGRHDKAVDYWYKAGQQAIQRSAYVEAMAHLNRGRALLLMLPESGERARRELHLRTTLGRVLMLTKGHGHPEVEQTFLRARALCQHIGDHDELLPVLSGLRVVTFSRAELHQAQAFADEYLHVAQARQDPVLLSRAYTMLGETSLYLGAFTATREYMERCLALYDPQQNHRSDLRYEGPRRGVLGRVYLAKALWILGYPEQALTRIDAARTLASQLAHPVSVAFALDFAAGLHLLRREVQAMQTQAHELLEVAQQQVLPFWVAWAQTLQGWVLAVQDKRQIGLDHMWEGLAACRATGLELDRPWVLGLIAELYGQGRQSDDGLRVLSEALVLVDKTGERWYEAELHRHKGELLLQQSADNQSEPETCFQKALDIARSQEAKSWELRAATSLARLWQQQGRCQAAYDLLASVYNWFTEGFATLDLKEAKALLEELA
jgi:class 3 adenylate cyclase/predicted ATPase